MVSNKNKKDEKTIDVSVIFEKFGKYQMLQYLYICLPACFVNLLSINYIFLAGDIGYRCRIPECETESAGLQPEWWPGSGVDRCARPVLSRDTPLGQCTNNSFTGGFDTCTEWIYESNNTIIAELNLACQPWKSSLVGTINCVGVLVSMVIGGWLADKYGRKPSIVFFSVAACVGHIKTFATSYYFYIFIEFLEALLSGGVNSATMVAMIEIAGPRHRLLSGVLYAYAVYLGESVFALIAMYVNYWKDLARIIYSFPIFFITYIFLIKESPRWLILNGKLDKAKALLKHLAKTNDINLNEQELDDMSEAELKKKFNMGTSVKKDSFKKVFGSKELLLRLSVGSVCRFTASFVYYGLMVNSVWLPGNKYTNFMLATVMSYPGELVSLYLMNKVGRKLPLIVGYILSGLTCVVSAYIPKEYPWAIILLFLVGKMIIAACFTGAVSYTLELFPTSARGFLLGLCSFASRVGGMLAPLTPMLLDISPVLPSIFFGGSALLSGILLTLTPETKGQPLLDTMDQLKEAAALAKELKKKKKLGKENPGYDSDTTAV